MKRSRGLTLPAVLGALVLFSILYLAVSFTTSQARHRLAASKHQEAARWLAESGLDVGEARYRAGKLARGQSLKANFAQGELELSVQDGVLVATGRAGGQRHQERRALR